jgi:hypothetical protein
VNLVRLGHYFTPSSSEGEELSGSCRTALVVDVPVAEGPNGPGKVNLVIWEHDGDQFDRLNVPIDAPSLVGASFHLAMECPWTR